MTAYLPEIGRTAVPALGAPAPPAMPMWRDPLQASLSGPLEDAMAAFMAVPPPMVSGAGFHGGLQFGGLSGSPVVAPPVPGAMMDIGPFPFLESIPEGASCM